MTSYPVGNKITLSWKPCIADKVTMDHYQQVMVTLSESVMKKCIQRSPADKSRDVISGWQYIFLISETMHRRYKGLLNTCISY